MMDGNSCAVITSGLQAESNHGLQAYPQSAVTAAFESERHGITRSGMSIDQRQQGWADIFGYVTPLFALMSLAAPAGAADETLGANSQNESVWSRNLGLMFDRDDPRIFRPCA
jgi:hypothetical protein